MTQKKSYEMPLTESEMEQALAELNESARAVGVDPYALYPNLILGASISTMVTPIGYAWMNNDAKLGESAS